MGLYSVVEQLRSPLNTAKREGLTPGEADFIGTFTISHWWALVVGLTSIGVVGFITNSNQFRDLLQQRFLNPIL